MGEKKPNICWFITDQQSANMMSCTGNRYVNTPNMDELARHSTRYTHAYCTNPVCQPSRFSLMTGLYAGAVGMQGDGKILSDAPLPKAILDNGPGHLLRGQGYHTVYGGKQGIPRMDAVTLGFDYGCADERDGLADFCADYIRQYTARNPDGTPFFMVASFINPHDICLMAISDFAAMADNEADKRIAANMPEVCASVRDAARGATTENCPPLPTNDMPAPDEPEAISMLLRERGFRQLARERYSEMAWRVHRYAYARLTETVDRQIGTVLDALRDSGLWDNTVIMMTSDHGDMDAAHKMEHKSALYQECCRVPLLVKGVAAEAPLQPPCDDRLVCNGLDCLCTVLDYGGVARPAYLMGQSLRPGGLDSGRYRESLVVESEQGVMAVDGRYKYTRYFMGARAEQFFDLKENPGEMYNQLDDSRYVRELTRLKAVVEGHLRERAAGFRL